MVRVAIQPLVRWVALRDTTRAVQLQHVHLEFSLLLRAMILIVVCHLVVIGAKP